MPRQGNLVESSVWPVTFATVPSLHPRILGIVDETYNMSPPTDMKEVLTARSVLHLLATGHEENGTFRNADEHQAALELRDAVLRLRRDGAFIAVPLFRVNSDPIGPHPVEKVCLCLQSTSVLVFTVSNRDHEFRNAWIGPSFPLDLSTLPVKSEEIPLQYPSLKLGYSSETPPLTIEERRKMGARLEQLLSGEKEAAKAPSN
ncbi:uncharacterized protein FIBRA_08001 [Fibroporia radiculosa]|uniref:Uncharacterized protein n=1 Tax=Fibroporia radiculosa TaxID=599839 RepID=J4GG58_9APHY|nr:uncharacterized protein FIBRA_08001 [Fibroporia radiculosa]CCM05768.1 predicted protein [Fibroporia radiculosa]